MKLISTLKGDGNRAQLLRGGAGALILKVLNIVLALAASIVLTRILGVEQFGIYTFVFSIIVLLMVPAQFGMTTLVVRETAKAEAEKNWGLLTGLWRWTNSTAIGISLVIIIICVLYVKIFAMSTHEITNINAFLYALIAIPFIALSNLRGAALQGLRKIIQGQLPESIIRPLLLIILLLAVAAFSAKAVIAKDAVLVNVVATVIAFIVGAWLLRRYKPSQMLLKPQPQYKSKLWLKSIIPLSLLEGVSIINLQTDIVMLGLLGTTVDVGLYRVASQGAMITTLGLTAVAMAVMPFFTRFYVQGDLIKLSRSAVISARASMLLAIPASLVFIFYGDSVLTLVFGEDFTKGYAILVILTCVQLINAMFGTSGRLLNMTGHEQDTLKGMTAAALCNVLLNFILIPLYGAEGAAWATGSSILLRNIILWLMVYQRLGIDTSVFGVFHNKDKLKAVVKRNV